MFEILGHLPCIDQKKVLFTLLICLLGVSECVCLSWVCVCVCVLGGGVVGVGGEMEDAESNLLFITKTCLLNYNENFTTKK